MAQILVVDDEPFNLLLLSEHLAEGGYQVDQAESGEAAWAMVQSKAYDLILLDRLMPGLDGLSLLKRIKAEGKWKAVPVIMQTSADSQEDIREGLVAGAHYYLTKPYTPSFLLKLVSTVISEASERQNLRESNENLLNTIAALSEASFEFRTLAQARSLAAGLSFLCADSSASGMGLLELMFNAVEHGNLGISYAEKSSLRQQDKWEFEIERRLSLEPWRSRSANISVKRFGAELEFIITDQGDGFNWSPYLQLDPKRAFDLNGRGIAMAKMFGFSLLEYQGAGNIVVARSGRSV